MLMVVIQRLVYVHGCDPEIKYVFMVVIQILSICSLL